MERERRKGEAFSYAMPEPSFFAQCVVKWSRFVILQRRSSDRADDASSSMRRIHFLNVMTRDQRVR